MILLYIHTLRHGAEKREKEGGMEEGGGIRWWMTWRVPLCDWLSLSICRDTPTIRRPPPPPKDVILALALTTAKSCDKGPRSRNCTRHHHHRTRQVPIHARSLIHGLQFVTETDTAYTSGIMVNFCPPPTVNATVLSKRRVNASPRRRSKAPRRYDSRSRTLYELR